MSKYKSYLMRLILSIDQFLNVLCFNGDEDETISSNFGKRSQSNAFRKFIDMWFGKGHCEKSIEPDEGRPWPEP